MKLNVYDFLRQPFFHERISAVMQRMIALIILLIPGILAVLGIKWMRDTFFGILHPLIPFLWLQFLLGLLLFLIGLGFIGGFILHRDRKRNKVQPRFQKRKNGPNT
jgi:polyferredoxin